MRCEHLSCGNSEMVWIPYIYKGRDRGLKHHNYCTKCGLVKCISSEKAHRIGYYINLLANLNKLYRITQIQMRMISKELENEMIDDTYGLDKSMQEKLFIKIVKKYVNAPENYLIKLLI